MIHSTQEISHHSTDLSRCPESLPPCRSESHVSTSKESLLDHRRRQQLKNWDKECKSCDKRCTKPAAQIMAPLPEMRLGMPMRAVAKCCVDYARPFVTKMTKEVSTKTYMCLFTVLFKGKLPPLVSLLARQGSVLPIRDSFLALGDSFLMIRDSFLAIIAEPSSMECIT